MFAVLRGAAVIGLIFILSPVRESPDWTGLKDAAGSRLTRSLAEGLIGPAAAALPDDAAARLGRKLGRDAVEAALAPSGNVRLASQDTLRPADRLPAWRGKF